MVDWAYWVGTFLSTPLEVVVSGATLLVAGAVAYAYPDRRDYVAAAALGPLVVSSLALADPAALAEWHYWLGGVLLSAALIVVVDRSDFADGR